MTSIVSCSAGDELVTIPVSSAAELDTWWKKQNSALLTSVSCSSTVAVVAKDAINIVAVHVGVPLSTKAPPSAWAGTLAEWKGIAASVASASSQQLIPSCSGYVRKVSAQMVAVSPSRAASLSDTAGDGNGANEVLIGTEFVLLPAAEAAPAVTAEQRTAVGPQLRDALIGLVCRHYPGMHGSPRASIHYNTSSTSPPAPAPAPALGKPPPSPNSFSPSRLSAGAAAAVAASSSPLGAVALSSSLKPAARGGSAGAGAGVAGPEGVHERTISQLSVGSDSGSICETHARTLSQQGVDDFSTTGIPAFYSDPAAAAAYHAHHHQHHHHYSQQQQYYYSQQQQQHQQQPMMMAGAAVPPGVVGAYYPSPQYSSPTPAAGGGHARVGSRGSHGRTFSNNSQSQQPQYYQQQQQQQPYYGQPPHHHYPYAATSVPPPVQHHARVSSSPPPTYNEALHLIGTGVTPAGPVVPPPTVTVGKTAKQIQQEAVLNVRVTIGGQSGELHARTHSTSSIPGASPRAAGGGPSREPSMSNSNHISGNLGDAEIVQHPGGIVQQGTQSFDPLQQPSTTPPQYHGHQRHSSTPTASVAPPAPGHRKRTSNLALALTASPTENAAAISPPMDPSQPPPGASRSGNSPQQQQHHDANIMNCSITMLPQSSLSQQ